MFAPLLKEGNLLLFGDDLSGGLIQKATPILVLKMLPLKTTINNTPIYYNLLHNRTITILVNLRLFLVSN